MEELTKTGRKAARSAATKALGLRRRQVLAGAAVAAGGLTVSRLLGLHVEDVASSLTRPAIASPAAVTGTQDWSSPLDRPEARVGQLLRRATFGMTRAQYAAAVADGFDRTVDKLIETPAAMPKDFPGGDAATRDKPLNVVALQTWWIDQMLSTPTPFAERMTFFWHGHFTSDYRKVTPQTPFIYWQNLTWRKIALGGFRDMLHQVTVDPGMLRYLDLGQSTGRAPNENYSRELMELFSMGVGTFTEDDVRGGAKALAGWREPITADMAQALMEQQQQRGARVRTISPDAVRTGIFDPTRAYSGTVTFLGETRRWDTDAVLDKIVAQESVAPYIAGKILREFVMADPPDAYVKRIADGWRQSRYDVKALMRDVFKSPEFVQPAAYRALVKSPTELLVHLARALEAPTLSRAIAAAGQTMGQALFDPPEVGGWPTNASWISTNDVLSRVNFVVSTLGATQKVPAFGNAHQVHLDGIVGEKTAQLLDQATDDQTRWLILLASPEFQLK